MAISDLNSFLNHYFQAHHCDILHNNDGVLTVQLTENLDRALMNRPFYWHYVKKMGKPGEPMKLTLITNPDKRDVKGEKIHFGSPRLQQILNHVKQHEKFTRLFQSINTTANTALHPWLVTNIKISYIGKQKKDELFSIGLNLVNGKMKSDMMESLKLLDLQMTISDYCYTISPLIRLRSGFGRIESVIDNYLKNQQHMWAEESLRELEKEIQLLKHFYIGETDDDEAEQMEKEINEISERYKPRITIQVINGGIFYLSNDF